MNISVDAVGEVAFVCLLCVFGGFALGRVDKEAELADRCKAANPTVLHGEIDKFCRDRLYITRS